MGVSGTVGVRWCAGARGSEVTTSGSWRVFSAWSIAATSAGGANDDSNGVEKTRRASPWHVGQLTDVGAVPIVRSTSNAPSLSQRYS